jgi:hypothetical protein
MSDVSMRIIYPNDDGGVAVVVPAPGTGLTIQELAERVVPHGKPYQIVPVTEIPSDRSFRNAWEYTE